jgi:hypothetical protein
MAGAIGAGAMAYFGAVRQVRLQEHEHEARALAYRFRLIKVIQEYLAKVTKAYNEARRQMEALRDGSGSFSITSFAVERPPALNDENWESHALLGPRVVELILAVDEASLRLAQFDKEIQDKGIKTDSHFVSGTMARRTDDGDISYERKQAIVDYVEVLEQLRQALMDLQKELAKPPRILPWTHLRRLILHQKPGRRRRRSEMSVNTLIPSLDWMPLKTQGDNAASLSSDTSVPGHRSKPGPSP